MRLVFARAILFIAAATFAFFGAAYLVVPDKMTAVVGITLHSSAARADVRAVYGGLELAIAGLLFACLPRRLSQGLLCAAVLYLGLALGRLAGALLDEPAPVTLRIFAGEIFAAVGTLFGWWLARPRALPRQDQA